MQAPVNLAAAYNAEVFASSSALPGCEAANVLTSPPDAADADAAGEALWLTDPDAGLPASFDLEITAGAGAVSCIRTFGWYCWHEFSTNPARITLHTSRDGGATWDARATFEALPRAGRQFRALPTPIALKGQQINPIVRERWRCQAVARVCPERARAAACCRRRRRRRTCAAARCCWRRRQRHRLGEQRRRVRTVDVAPLLRFLLLVQRHGHLHQRRQRVVVRGWFGREQMCVVGGRLPPLLLLLRRPLYFPLIAPLSEPGLHAVGGRRHIGRRPCCCCCGCRLFGLFGVRVRRLGRKAPPRLLPLRVARAGVLEKIGGI